MKDLADMDWAEAFARLHPVLLHLPVGLFIALAWLLLWGWFKRDKSKSGPARGALVLLLVVSTPTAAASGWFLHEGGAYPEPVELHEWFGISLAFVALAIGLAHMRGSNWYARLVWLGALLMIPTAHFGGTVTHGEGFLTDPWRAAPPEEEPESQPEPRLDEEQPAGEGGEVRGVVAQDPVSVAPQFADILPIFEELCTRCHGERKQRGGLALNTLQGALVGGDSGPALVPGDADSSFLLTNMLLPLDEDEHMPPPKKSQPSREQLRLIEAFVRGVPVEDVPQQSGPSPVEPAEELALEVSSDVTPELVAAAIRDLRERRAHVQPLATDDQGLWIDFTATELVPGELKALLEPLRALVVELGLSGKPLDGADIQFLGGLPALAVLDLRGLPQENALDLGALAASTSLRVLKLAGTPLDVSALAVLEGMDGLEQVFLWETGIEGDLEGLRERRPGLQALAGVEAREALELEPEVVFERVPEPGTTDVQAANKMCPVTDKPVDPRYVVVFEGRAIGFCCPNCPKTFWEDPSKYVVK